MKNWSLTRKIATVGCLLAAISLAVFLVLASDRTVDVSSDSEHRYENARLITPKTFGSYGELMFAYVGEGNFLYNLDDESRPLIQQPVKELLYASDDSVLYTASCEIDMSHLGRESVIQELQIGEHENQVNTIARVTIDPCWSSNDEVIYYVEDTNRAQLCTFEPLTSTSEIAAEFEQDILGLRISSDGLLVLLADGAELLYVPLSKQLVEPGINARGSVITVCEQYDLILSPDGILSYHWQGSDESVVISEDVIVGISHQDNEIYYIKQENGNASLMCYVVSEEQHQTLAALEGVVLPQLTSDADYAFVVTDLGIVYRYDIQENTLIPFHFIETESVKAPLISLFDYRLMVYDLAKEQDASFCYSIPSGVTITAEESEMLVEQARELSNEAMSQSPSEEYSFLSIGAIGENVLNLQNALISHGYLQMLPTSVYGVETMHAVMMAQSDLNLPETGYADKLFQALLMSSDIYYQVRPVEENEGSIRARDLTARLASLGYVLSSTSDGQSERLHAGIVRFCEVNELEYDGTAISESVQSAAFAKEALRYSAYYDLRQGDIGDNAYALNAQLFSLRYSPYSPRPAIDDDTVSSVTLFATVNQMEYDGVITPAIQSALFSDNAAACPVELQPTSLAEAESSTPGQIITDRELKILRKWLTKSFAVNHTDRQAVKRLQVKLIRLGYLAEERDSMIYDEYTAEAIRRFQVDHDLPTDGIPTKKTLMMVFGITNSTLSGE